MNAYDRKCILIVALYMPTKKCLQKIKLSKFSKKLLHFIRFHQLIQRSYAYQIPTLAEYRQRK